MERLKHLKEKILCCVEGEACNLGQADAKELGEAIDMLKDLEEAIYYATITKAMGDNEKDSMLHSASMYYPSNSMYFPEKGETGHYMIYYDPYRDMDRDKGKMYYSGPTVRNGVDSYPGEMRDRREGRSPMNRKMYMESKELHHGKEIQMKELEKYMQELTNDVTEMIRDASPEEKQLLQKKIATLAEKVGQMNV